MRLICELNSEADIESVTAKVIVETSRLTSVASHSAPSTDNPAEYPSLQVQSDSESLPGAEIM